jgi:4-oxalocrotonate tautomerase
METVFPISMKYILFVDFIFINEEEEEEMPVIQITISQGRSVEQKRELVQILTRETARIMKTKEENVRILIYEVTKENWGNAGTLALDMK